MDWEESLGEQSRGNQKGGWRFPCQKQNYMQTPSLNISPERVLPLPPQEMEASSSQHPRESLLQPCPVPEGYIYATNILPQRSWNNRTLVLGGLLRWEPPESLLHWRPLRCKLGTV